MNTPHFDKALKLLDEVENELLAQDDEVPGSVSTEINEHINELIALVKEDKRHFTWASNQKR